MFGVGTGEIIVILVIAMLVVGPERMVEFASQLGQFIAKFRRETSSMTQEFREAFSLETATEALSGSEPAAAGGAATAESLGDGTSGSLSEGSTELLAHDEEGPGDVPPESEAAFADGETERSLSDGDAGDDGAPEGTDAELLDAEPVTIKVGELVPKDEEVEPVVVGQTLLVVVDSEKDANSAERSSQGEGQ